MKTWIHQISEYPGFNYGHFCWTDKRAADEDADKKSDKYCFFPSGILQSFSYRRISTRVLDFSSSSPSTLCRCTSWASLCDRNRRSCRNREEQRSRAGWANFPAFWGASNRTRTTESAARSAAANGRYSAAAWSSWSRRIPGNDTGFTRPSRSWPSWRPHGSHAGQRSDGTWSPRFRSGHGATSRTSRSS